MTPASIRVHATQLAEAAIDAVKPESLLPQRLACRDGELLLDGTACAEIPRRGGRIVVVGGGKAAAGLAAAVERLLDAALATGHDIRGLVSVPEGCGRSLARVEVRETRPAAVNLPTAEAVAATREMRALLAALGRDDLAIVLVTGGGSALLEDPAPGTSLDDLITVTRFLSAAGADIRELNVVRQALSLAKAGGLARACGAGRLVALVLSDISGDPLELIASGPCMPVAPDPHAALEVLRRHEATSVAATITRQLERRAAEAAGAAVSSPANGEWTTPAGCRVSHVLLGSNATAVDAAARAARRLGYDAVIRTAAETSESADAVGGRLVGEAATLLAEVARDGRPRAVLEGGEAVVTVPADHGTGGRNQQTVLAAAAAWPPGVAWPTGLLIASLATDGEDGPTDAAGGLVDDEIAKRLLEGGDLPRAVARCDAYPALAAAGGLVRTGPTGTNVADVRIILARP